jgi:hypothetical protein
MMMTFFSLSFAVLPPEECVPTITLSGSKYHIFEEIIGHESFYLINHACVHVDVLSGIYFESQEVGY